VYEEKNFIKNKDKKNIKIKNIIKNSKDNKLYSIMGYKINIDTKEPNVPGHILKYPE